MTKDYAKRYRRRGSSKNGSHVRLWIFTLLFFFLFTMGLVYLGKYQQQHPYHLKTNKASVESSITTPEKKTKATKKTKPVEFDFYKPVTIPKTTTSNSEPGKAEAKSAEKTNQSKDQTKAPDATTTKTTTSTPSTKVSYWLEIVTAKSYADADQQKAQLALLGFESKIKQQSPTQYQVMMGPYKTQAKAQNDVKRLQSNKINSTLQKI
jgi:cell division protein FtsN